MSWRSKKQGVMVRLSAEVEFQAMAFGVCELLWLQIMLEDLKVSVQRPLELWCDN